MKKHLIAIVFAAFSAGALSQEVLRGHVTVVESTYMPGAITFQMNVGTPKCPKGVWLTWQKDPENNKTVYGTLLAAITSGREVTLYADYVEGQCIGRFLHFN